MNTAEEAAVIAGGDVEEGRTVRDENASAGGTGPDVAALMQMLIEDRRRRESEIAEERIRQERDMERRVNEMKEQMETMYRLMERSGKSKSNSGEALVKVAKLSDVDDIEGYLLTFERQMVAYEVDKSRWAYILAPHLTGKAQKAYMAIAADEAGDYALIRRACLTRAPVLKSPDMQLPFILQTDASERGIGAVLSQCSKEGEEHPVAFYSRKLLPREERYSTVEKECLAIKLGVQAFRVYLLGRPFVVQTDHRSLEYLHRLKENNARLTRWSLSLQPYDFTVEHRAGRNNGNADGLSRGATD